MVKINIICYNHKKFLFFCKFYHKIFLNKNGDWGLGIGDWG